MGKKQEAIEALAATHRIDPLDVRTMAERWLASGTPDSRTELTAAMTQFPATAEETAAEYLNAGLWSDGAKILSAAIAAAPDQAKIQPMVYYYLGYFFEKLNQPQKAAEDYAMAAKMPSDYVFPFQNEAIEVLNAAMKANPNDAHAPYYLGNLLFDSQPDEAITLWQSSAALDPSNAIVHRNLGIAFSIANQATRSIRPSRKWSWPYRSRTSTLCTSPNWTKCMKPKAPHRKSGLRFSKRTAKW